jgi:hypothetical protein
VYISPSGVPWLYGGASEHAASWGRSGIAALYSVYGLGTCISAPLVCLGCMVVLVSMLLAGDGQVQ